MRLSNPLARLAPPPPLLPHTANTLHQDEQPPPQQGIKRRRRRSSFDTLVIPHRTRLPSTRIGEVKPIDLAVARNLLDAAAASVSNASERRGSCGDDESESTGSDHRQQLQQEGTRSPSCCAGGEFYVGQHSRTGSWAAAAADDELRTPDDVYEEEDQCSRAASGSSSSVDWRQQYELGGFYDGPNDFADGAPFVNPYTLPQSTWVGNVNVLRIKPAEAAKSYNALAAANGLEAFDVRLDYVSHVVQTPPVESEKSLFGKAVKGAKKIIPSSSSTNLKKSPPLLPSTSLFELCHHGGCDEMKLPTEFSPNESLLIPRSLAALGGYIVENGPLIPGIFREEGSSNDVTTLFEYYAKHPRPVRGNRLPSYMNFTVHEVGTAYKRVVKGLPGGLLGSSELLATLRDILLHMNQDGRLSEEEATELRVRLIALALSCVHSDSRFSVICATLGLYAWIGHATEASEGGPANMNCKNLSSLLGPLLVGEELNDIKGVRAAPGTQLDAQQVAEVMANNQEAIAIAFMLITNWKGIVEELRTSAVSAAADLRYEEEGRRLANAQSQYTLQSRDAPVQGRQPPDVLNESAVAGNKGKLAQSFFHPLRAFRSFSRDRGPKPDAFVTESGDPNSPRTFRLPLRVADGTGGFTWVYSLQHANDGHKRRAATSRRPNHTKPRSENVDTTVRHRHRSVYPYGHPGLEEQIEAASSPVVNYASVNQAARHRHIGVVNEHEIKAERQPRLGPTYETHDQPEDDFSDEEIPSEDRISNYEDLLSPEASQSDRGEIDPGERFGDGDSFSVNDNSENESEQDERLHNGLLEPLTEYRESYLHLERCKREYTSNPVRNEKDQEDLTSYENQPAEEALGQPATATRPANAIDSETLMDRPNHSAQSSVDIQQLAKAHTFAVHGSTPRRRRTAPFLGVNEVDEDQVTQNQGFLSDHARSQTANSVTSSQSGSVRQLVQRFEPQSSQGHYVPPWMNASGKPIHKKVPTTSAAEGKARAEIRNDSGSDSDLPHVENFEETPTPRARTTDDGSKLPLVKSSENTPTPRARSLIPKPLSDIGRSRRKGEQRDSLSPSPTKYVGGSNTVQMRPPIYHAPISNKKPQRYLMSGALHPADMPSRRPLSPIRVPNPSYLSDPPAARKVEPSKALSNRMTTSASSQSSSLLQSDQTAMDEIPTRPMTLDANNTFAPNHAESHSQPGYSASQDGDDYAYSASEYTEHSANTDSIDNERQAESMEHIHSAEDEITEEELARRQRSSAEIYDRGVRRLMAEYDHYLVGKQACHLKLTGRMSFSSLSTMTSQEYIEKNDWDVEEKGPPPKQRTRAERHMDEDTAFIINGRRQFDMFPELEAGQRREMQPFIEKVLAAREPKSEAALAKELEEFKDKMEKCRVWDQERPARRRAYEAERGRWAAEREKERAAFEALSDKEKRAWMDRKAKEKLEKICREADESKAAKKEHRWSRKRKGSGEKSGEKSGDSGESKTKHGINRPGIRGGKVSALRKLFGGGMRKGS